MKVLSLSGRDGVGKTEQIKMLKYYNNDMLNFTGSLTDYSNKWAKLNPIDGFNWWFKDISFIDLISIIKESLKKRHDNYHPDKININDRGSLMFKAVCSATIATREKIPIIDIINLVDELFSEEIDVSSNNEYEILLVPNIDYEANIKKFIQITNNKKSEYLTWQTEMYAEYQKFLLYFINYYFQNKGQKGNIYVDSCIIDTQNRIRSEINKIFNINMPMLCENFEKLIAFGGLSESGKSSFAEQLSLKRNFCRLKIKYFNEVICDRGENPNPELLGKEFVKFFQNHKHITKASIESLHGDDLPAYLKLLFGSRFKIAYIETSEDIRVSRTAQVLNISEEEALIKTRDKDREKISKGSDRVKSIADIIINNNYNGLDYTFNLFAKDYD